MKQIAEKFNILAGLELDTSTTEDKRTGTPIYRSRKRCTVSVISCWGVTYNTARAKVLRSRV